MDARRHRVRAGLYAIPQDRAHPFRPEPERAPVLEAVVPVLEVRAWFIIHRVLPQRKVTGGVLHSARTFCQPRFVRGRNRHRVM